MANDEGPRSRPGTSFPHHRGDQAGELEIGTRETSGEQATPPPEWPPAEIVAALLKGGVPGAARVLGVSPATLRREFYRRGASARECLKAERRRQLVRLLGRGIPAVQVAHHLGFSNERSVWRFSIREIGWRPSDIPGRVSNCGSLRRAMISKEK